MNQNDEDKCKIGDSFHIGVSINIMCTKHQIPLQSCDVVFNKINGLFYHCIFINLVFFLMWNHRSTSVIKLTNN
jgi:hypothetical protein